ncbi:MAG: hypothetical protein DME26_19185 [Verrucomicrobia bacterium]|nr:MAG: hypothetical protein DME26_19185 [Verrucomicrobiota bacterium]
MIEGEFHDPAVTLKHDRQRHGPLIQAVEQLNRIQVMIAASIGLEKVTRTVETSLKHNERTGRWQSADGLCGWKSR